MPTQFPYPGVPWSQGNMRKANVARSYDPSRGFRELEGIRKEKSKETKASQADLSPEQMSDDQLHQHYLGQMQEGKAIQIPEGEREFNIYMQALDSKRKKPPDPYQMSPRQLRDEGIVQPDVDQYGSQTWQGFMREKMKQ